LTGATGNTGPAGPTGATGPAGSQGNPGTTGATGATGAQGNPGATGVTGPQGSPGTTGATGPTGPQGPSGLGNSNQTLTATYPTVPDITWTTVCSVSIVASGGKVLVTGNVHGRTILANSHAAATVFRSGVNLAGFGNGGLIPANLARFFTPNAAETQDTLSFSVIDTAQSGLITYNLELYVRNDGAQSWAGHTDSTPCVISAIEMK
jgi:hypothetical protein